MAKTLDSYTNTGPVTNTSRNKQKLNNRPPLAHSPTDTSRKCR